MSADHTLSDQPYLLPLRSLVLPASLMWRAPEALPGCCQDPPALSCHRPLCPLVLHSLRHHGHSTKGGLLDLNTGPEPALPYSPGGGQSVIAGNSWW